MMVESEANKLAAELDRLWQQQMDQSGFASSTFSDAATELRRLAEVEKDAQRANKNLDAILRVAEQQQTRIEKLTKEPTDG